MYMYLPSFFFHHIDGVGYFGGGVDDACPVPGTEGQVIQRELPV